MVAVISSSLLFLYCLLSYESVGLSDADAERVDEEHCLPPSMHVHTHTLARHAFVLASLDSSVGLI